MSNGYYKSYTGDEKAMKNNYTEETIEDVLSYPIEAIEDRGITKKTAEKFGVRTAFSEKDGKTPIAYYFPYTIDGTIVGYKKRDLTKPKQAKGYFTIIGFQSVKCDLFGTIAANKTGGKRIWITEGEFDAMICWQVLKEKYPALNPSVVSISNGTASAVLNIAQKQNTKLLSKFQENIICFDNDEATPDEKVKGIMKGKEASAAVYGLLPEIKVVPLPEDKDPCDVFLEQPSELYWMLMKPIQYVPDGFIKYDQIREKTHELPTLGRPWPWPTVTKKTLGRRDGEGIYLGAGTKMGKSEFANKLIQHIVTTEKDIEGNPQKVAIFKFEEQPDETIKKIAGKFWKKDFANPEKIIFIDEEGKEVDIWGDKIIDNSSFYTQEDLIEATEEIGPNLILYNNYGSCRWDQLKGAIRHAVLVEHVKDIFIDPITRLTSGLDASAANVELETFADEISKMSQDLGFTYYPFCHLRAPNQGPSHEMGGKIMSSQFRGSRAMQQACHYMFGLEGNKDPELTEKERNTRWLVGLEDRKHGRTFKIPLFYDKDTGDFIEPPEGFLEDDTCQTLAEWYASDRSYIPEQDGDYTF